MASILEHDITGFKIAYIITRPGKNRSLIAEPIIIRLRIPKGAYVTNTKHKRRCSRAIVEEFIGVGHSKAKKKTAHSFYCARFVYKLGKEVVPEGGVFELDDNKICAEGIHFFDDVYDALHYFMTSGAMQIINRINFFFVNPFNHTSSYTDIVLIKGLCKTENFREFKK